jgi:hypothetical protein
LNADFFFFRQPPTSAKALKAGGGQVKFSVIVFSSPSFAFSVIVPPDKFYSFSPPYSLSGNNKKQLHLTTSDSNHITHQIPWKI